MTPIRMIALLALAASSPSAAGTARRGRSAPAAAPSAPQIGRCHMGGCSWFQVRQVQVARRAGGARLLRLVLRYGESDHPDYRIPGSSRGVSISWNPPSTAYLFCSRRLPAIITRSADGWSATPLVLLGGPAITENEKRVYLHVCHRGQDWQTVGSIERLGYDTSAELPEEFRLTRPAEIFERVP